MQRDAAHAGQETGTWRRRRGAASRQAFGHQCTVQGHRLRRVLDAAGCAQPAIRPQRMIGGAMAARLATNLRGVPGQHGVEQTHAALVGDAAGNPVAVQRLRTVQHGATSIAICMASR